MFHNLPRVPEETKEKPLAMKVAFRIESLTAFFVNKRQEYYQPDGEIR
jgi:hypothetical protein